MLRNKFVVFPTGKASGNVTFVWQCYHAHVLINKFCLNNVNNITSIYMKAIKPVDKIESDNTSFLKKR